MSLRTRSTERKAKDRSEENLSRTTRRKSFPLSHPEAVETRELKGKYRNFDLHNECAEEEEEDLHQMNGLPT